MRQVSRLRRGQSEQIDSERRVHHPDVHANSKQSLERENVRPTGEQFHQSPLPFIPSPKLHLYIWGENRVGIPQHSMHWATSHNQSLPGELSGRNFSSGHVHVYGATKSSSSRFELKYLLALCLIGPNRGLPWGYGRFWIPVADYAVDVRAHAEHTRHIPQRAPPS
jgi:hypothetical protein